MTPADYTAVCRTCALDAREEAGLGPLPGGVATSTQRPCQCCGKLTWTFHPRVFGSPWAPTKRDSWNLTT